MKDDTKKELKQYLHSFIDRQVRKLPYTLEELKAAYPFHSLFFVKTAQPKKEDCVRSKRRLLIFKACNINKTPQAYVAFYYNPYIKREKYNWWPAVQILDIDNEVLMGEEMWEYLGGPGTYSEILEIVEEVKKERKS